MVDSLTSVSPLGEGPSQRLNLPLPESASTPLQQISALAIPHINSAREGSNEAKKIFSTTCKKEMDYSALRDSWSLYIPNNDTQHLSLFLENSVSIDLIDSYDFSAIFLSTLCLLPSNIFSVNYWISKKSNGKYKIIQDIILESAATPLLNSDRILFIFPQMRKSLDKILCQQIIELPSELLILEWYTLFHKKNLHCSLPVIQQAFQTLTKVKTLLISKPNATHEELLKAVSPSTAAFVRYLICDTNKNITNRERQFRGTMSKGIRNLTLQAPLEILYQWITSFNVMEPYAQESFLITVKHTFPDLAKLSLSYCLLDNTAFLNLVKDSQLKEISLSTFPNLTKDVFYTLIDLYIELIFRDEFSLTASDFADVVQYAWKNNIKLSLHIREQLFEITKSNLNALLTKALLHHKQSVAHALVILGAQIDHLTTKINDSEGHYYLLFEKAYENGEALEQVLYLEQIGCIFLDKKDFFRAAHIINQALAAALLYEIDQSYQYHLFSKLEHIEKCFLENLGIKAATSHSIFVYRKRLETIRKDAELKLNIEMSIDAIQKELTVHFCELLTDLIKSSMERLQKGPPTKYAFIGVGSMSRQEMCPYSDLEYAILIEKSSPQALDYFRQLSLFLELRIINLGETTYPIIRPKKDDESFNECTFTPHGFCLDNGGISPKGKQDLYELIGTPSQLAMFQTPAWLKKNDGETVLVNALTQCCFITGNAELVKSYERCIKEILDTRTTFLGKKVRQERALSLLKGHLKEFQPFLTQQRFDIRAFDAKKDFYRPLQMIIGTLALYYCLENSNTHGYILKLHTNGIFNSDGTSKIIQMLKYALMWRVKAHLYYKTEREILFHAHPQENINGSLFTFTDQDSKVLLDLYRVLIPLNKAANAFLNSEDKTVFNCTLYDSAIGSSDYMDEANLLYHSALDGYIQAAALLPNDPEALDNLQRIQRQLGRLHTSLKYNRERLSIVKRLHGNDHEEVAMVLNSLGETLHLLGESKKAIDYFREALRINKLKFNDDHPQVIKSIHNLGMASNGAGNKRLAIQYLTQAIALLRKVHLQDNPQFATALNNLGTIYKETGQLKMALELFLESLNMSTRLFTDEHPESITTLNNLAATRCAIGEFSQAITAYEKILRILNKVYREIHPHIAVAHNNLGECWQALGEYDKAKKCYLKSEDILGKIYTFEHPLYAVVYNNLCSLLGSLDQYEEAIKYGEKALKIEREFLGDEHPNLAVTLNNLGSALKSTGKIEQAMRNYDTALKIVLKVYGEQHTIAATIYCNIGIAQYALDQKALAIRYFEKAIAIEKECLGLDHYILVKRYNNLGDAYLGIGQVQQAIESYKEQLRISTKAFGKDHPKVAEAHTLLGHALKATQQLSKSLESYKEALRIYKQVYGDNHPLMLDSLRFISNT